MKENFARSVIRSAWWSLATG